MPAALARNPARLQADLDRLAGMDLAGLGARWRRVFGRAAPPSLSRALLARALAYRIQEIALGGLDREIAKALDRMAAGDGSVIPLPGRGSVPGTLLVREWQGTLHRVYGLENGSPGVTIKARASRACRRSLRTHRARTERPTPHSGLAAREPSASPRIEYDTGHAVLQWSTSIGRTRFACQPRQRRSWPNADGRLLSVGRAVSDCASAAPTPLAPRGSSLP
jgi:hypothetical protein